MSRFRRFGRVVERMKRRAADAAREHASYACVDCDERFPAKPDACPACGGEVREVDADR